VHQPDTTALQQCAPARALGLQIVEVARALVAIHTGEGSNEAEALLLRVFNDYMQVAPPDADANADADAGDDDDDDEIACALVNMHTGEGSNEAEALLLRVYNDYMQVVPPDADADDADADADALVESAGGIEFSENELSMFWMDVNDVRVES